MRTSLIAEIGVNHNGRLDLAMQLVEIAADAGASAAKFQTFRADQITVRNTATVKYQMDRSGADDQYAMLEKLELGAEDHEKLARRCAELGIEFLSTAFDLDSLDLLCRLGIKRIKIPSGEVANPQYLRGCARKGLPIILSTGMADLEEVREAVRIVTSEPAFSKVPSTADEPSLVVLHCTSAYPTNFEDVNLRAMTTMERELAVPVGYSDHSVGITVAPIAVAMGAQVIEKHVTLDRNMPGPDHSASIEPDELAALVRAISHAELVLGDGVKRPQAAEIEARDLVRRGLKAGRDLAAGTVLTERDIAVLRPATGLAPSRFDSAIGRTLIRSLKTGDPIEASDLS